MFESRGVRRVDAVEIDDDDLHSMLQEPTCDRILLQARIVPAARPGRSNIVGGVETLREAGLPAWVDKAEQAIALGHSMELPECPE